MEFFLCSPSEQGHQDNEEKNHVQMKDDKKKVQLCLLCVVVPKILVKDAVIIGADVSV